MSLVCLVNAISAQGGENSAGLFAAELLRPPVRTINGTASISLLPTVSVVMMPGISVSTVIVSTGKNVSRKNIFPILTWASQAALIFIKYPVWCLKSFITGDRQILKTGIFPARYVP